MKRHKRLIVHRQAVVNTLTTGPWLKRVRKDDEQHPVPVRMFSYSTPPTAIAPSNGEIVHGDNILNKLNVSHVDMDGNDITAGLAQLSSGDFLSVGGRTYNIVAPVVADVSGTFSYVTVDPEVQLQAGVYPVTAWKGAA